MICPIMPIKNEEIIGKVYTQCLKTDCAWFDNEQKQCAVLSININLIKIGEKQ